MINSKILFLDGCLLDGCFLDVTSYIDCQKNMISIVFRWLLMIFSLNKTPLGETGCLGNPYILLTGCLGIQFFDSPLSQHSQLCYLWLPTSQCAALV